MSREQTYSLAIVVLGGVMSVAMHDQLFLISHTLGAIFLLLWSRDWRETP